MRAEKIIKRFGGRDIICIDFDNNFGRQAYYKSTGRNSGEEGKWLPFDGIGFNLGHLWFDKGEYREGEGADGPLKFFKYSVLKEGGDFLNSMTLPVGEIDFPTNINNYINTDRSLFWNKHFSYLFEEMRREGRLDKYMED